jgi:hypothetical protein
MTDKSRTSNSTKTADRPTASRDRVGTESDADRSGNAKRTVPDQTPGSDARHRDTRIVAVEDADRKDLQDIGDMLRRHFDPILDEPVPEKLKAILRRGKAKKPEGDE